MSDRERDAQVEELLLAGLDHYFAGQHELAINVWTRVLFLDRGHARARAYIERARSAVAERQREADELLYSGAAALKRGDRVVARELLTSAVERGASGDEALALLHRLDRLDAATQDLTPSPAPAVPGSNHPPAPSIERDTRIMWLGGGIVAGALLAAIAVGYLWTVSDPFDAGASRRPRTLGTVDPLPVPSPGEIRILRARDLMARGYLREALATLEAGTVDDRHRSATDELRATIQRRLLDAARQRPAARPSAASPAPSPEP